MYAMIILYESNDIFVPNVENVAHNWCPCEGRGWWVARPSVAPWHGHQSPGTSAPRTSPITTYHNLGTVSNQYLTVCWRCRSLETISFVYGGGCFYLDIYISIDYHFWWDQDLIETYQLCNSDEVRLLSLTGVMWRWKHIWDTIYLLIDTSACCWLPNSSVAGARRTHSLSLSCWSASEGCWGSTPPPACTASSSPSAPWWSTSSWSSCTSSTTSGCWAAPPPSSRSSRSSSPPSSSTASGRGSNWSVYYFL